jgi:hypothetical protein
VVARNSRNSIELWGHRDHGNNIKICANNALYKKNMDEKADDGSFVSANLLRQNLENFKVGSPGFSSLAQKGDDEVC